MKPMLNDHDRVHIGDRLKDGDEVNLDKFRKNFAKTVPEPKTDVIIVYDGDDVEPIMDLVEFLRQRYRFVLQQKTNETKATHLITRTFH